MKRALGVWQLQRQWPPYSRPGDEIYLPTNTRVIAEQTLPYVGAGLALYWIIWAIVKGVRR